jgi:hypothetical protein
MKTATTMTGLPYPVRLAGYGSGRPEAAAAAPGNPMRMSRPAARSTSVPAERAWAGG